MNQVIETIKEVLAEVLQIDSKSIGDNSDIYNEFGMDSLAAVKTLALLDEKFGIEIPDENLIQIRTPSDLAKLVEACLETQKRTQI